MIKKKKSQVDKDLDELYNLAKKIKQAVECPHCGKTHDVDLGGDFNKRKIAMELRLKYEAIKAKQDPDNDDTGKGLEDNDEEAKDGEA